LTRSGQPATTIRISAEAPSRVADNLFWLGRYTERLEGTLRLLRCAFGRMSDESSPESPAELAALVEILALTDRMPKRLAGRVPAREIEQELLELVYNSQRLSGVRGIVLRLRHLAFTVRDRLSADTWRILDQLQVDSKSRAGKLRLANAQTVCNNLILDLAAFSGMEMENMTRGHGWRFLDLGRRLERACTLVDTLRASLQLHTDSNIARSLLEFADSAITYRRRYFSEPRLFPVLELLLTEPANPRSLAFQLIALRDHTAALPGVQGHAPDEELLKQADHFATKHTERISSALDAAQCDSLKEILQELSIGLTEFSDEITKQYFCHTISHRVEARG
jgi:uncharacterized alpha-E superfamily protein